MPPQIAAIVFATAIFGLFRLARDRESRTSPALWIPVVWAFIAGSRMVSEWLNPGMAMNSPEQYLDGSPLDRAILGGLLAAGIAVLLARAGRVYGLMRANVPIVVFFLYCLVSVLWSDHSDVAFRRWTKAIGDLVMVLVVLSDPDPSTAVKRFLTRLSFLLIPISVLLIKYYPELGRGYYRWTWMSYYSGVATGKNGLGYVCLVCGLASLWRLVGVGIVRDRVHRAGPLIAHGIILAMVLWLFSKAGSATSLVCFLVGSGLLLLATLFQSIRRPTAVHFLGGATAFFLFIGVLLSDWTSLVEALGRDDTLTGRTLVWNELLRVSVHPVFGTGFESFWLADRVEQLWRTYWWQPNQAHNGYLEVFLNLGWVGLALIGLVLVSGFRNVLAAVRQNRAEGGLRLAYFGAAIIYNLTEAAFKMMHPVWIVLLLAVAAVPPSTSRQPQLRPEERGA